MLDAFLDFAGQGLTFGVTGPGVAVDPATGRLAISSDALVSGVEVVVTAGNSGGGAESRFRVTVAPWRWPGPGRAGGAGARAGAGWWAARSRSIPASGAGEPAPELALQWRAGGAAIPGATGASFVPTPGRGRRGSRLPGDRDERRGQRRAGGRAAAGERGAARGLGRDRRPGADAGGGAGGRWRRRRISPARA